MRNSCSRAADAPVYAQLTLKVTHGIAGAKASALPGGALVEREEAATPS